MTERTCETVLNLKPTPKPTSKAFSMPDSSVGSSSLGWPQAPPHSPSGLLVYVPPKCDADTIHSPPRPKEFYQVTVLSSVVDADPNGPIVPDQLSFSIQGPFVDFAAHLERALMFPGHGANISAYHRLNKGPYTGHSFPLPTPQGLYVPWHDNMQLRDTLTAP